MPRKTRTTEAPAAEHTPVPVTKWRRGFIDANGEFVDGDIETLWMLPTGTLAAFRAPNSRNELFFQPAIAIGKIIARDEDAGIEYVSLLPCMCYEDAGLRPVSIQQDENGKSGYVGLLADGESLDRIMGKVEEDNESHATEDAQETEKEQ